MTKELNHNSTEKTTKKDNIPKDTILVIGDWFIDENWLVAPRKTYSSSHTGEYHFLSKHTQVDKRMISLCGTPEIMAVLKEYFDDPVKKDSENNPFKFIGFGVWNQLDEGVLQCTVCPHNTEKKFLTPYTIKALKDVLLDETTKERLCPYAASQKCKYVFKLYNLAPEIGQFSTNRIIRCYEGSGGSRPKLLYRFDWELPIDSPLNYKHFDKLNGTTSENQEESEPIENIKAVIIEDHGKGVITYESMKCLIEKLENPKNIRWYVRTKLNRPSWFKVFSKNEINLRLRVIDFKLAIHRKGQRRWIHNKELGRASLELLGDLTGDEISKYGKDSQKKPKCDRGAVIFEENTAIAKADDNCFNLHKSLGPRQLINIGRTTMFFNALVAQDLEEMLSKSSEKKDKNGSGNDKSFGNQCHRALRCAYEWSKKASEAWNKENIQFYGEYKDALNPLKNKQQEIFPEQKSYKKLCEKWKKSSKQYGILIEKIDSKGTKKKIFQTWRGVGALDNYICVGDRKRCEINDLLTKIHKFKMEKAPAHPFNCLLYSSPGWGKSYLAKSLAKNFDMLYLPFSLSQMATNKDLINCFDAICSMQNVTDKKVLIFIDEINCEIEGHTAMGLLLSPIWDGIFLREGRTYKIQPAVWIFASTGHVSDIAISGVNKGSDFLSRLNGPIIELNSIFTNEEIPLTDFVKTVKNDIITGFASVDSQPKVNQEIFKKMNGQFRTEQVYLAVTMLNRHEPISSIQEEVLKLFYDLFPINGFRSLEFFISQFHNIERGIVTCANVPTSDEYKELNRHIVLPVEWEKKDKRPKEDLKNLVSIENVIT